MGEKQKTEGWHPGALTDGTSPVAIPNPDAPWVPTDALKVAPGEASIVPRPTAEIDDALGTSLEWRMKHLPASADPTFVSGASVPKLGTDSQRWKVGDRVCFAHQPLGQVYRVTRVHKGDGLFIEIQNMPGLYASHIFVPAPAEPVSLPAVDLDPIPSPSREELQAEVVRLTMLINTPELIDFLKAVQIEAVHQRERWGSKQDEGKTAADWFWLLGYLAGKAISADKVGNRDKLLHHVITTAAACANWHAQILGKCDMRPGIETPVGEK